MTVLDDLIFGVRHIAEDGTEVPFTGTLNFGAGLTAEYDAANNRINITATGAAGVGRYTKFVSDADWTIPRAGDAWVHDSGMSSDRNITLYAAPNDGDRVDLTLDVGGHKFHVIPQGGIQINGGADFFGTNGKAYAVVYFAGINQWLAVQTSF